MGRFQGITMAIGASMVLERKYGNLDDLPLWVQCLV
jgi:hypothetical protein